ncbi:MAG: hypothetical protein ABI151_18440, partial [Chitinophagaceae bacterium]
MKKINLYAGNHKLLLLLLLNLCLILISAEKTFGQIQFSTPVNYAANLSPTDIAIAGFTGDGKPHLVIAHADENAISVILNTSQPCP